MKPIDELCLPFGDVPCTSRVCAPGTQRRLRVCCWLQDACCVLEKHTIGHAAPCVHLVRFYRV